jgi:hypothetical protein
MPIARRLHGSARRAANGKDSTMDSKDSKDSKIGGKSSASSKSADSKSKGQKSSSERGSATNHKKNPGKRPHQGGSSR